MQHLRDETHRAAITYQRKVRSKSSLISALEGIPGIGPARRKALLVQLGSIEAIAMATVAELCDVPGIGASTAETILRVLNGLPDDESPAEDPLQG
jgi:excinuclease ABC subunit C